MKKNISIIITAIAALCICLHPANASLLGMPLNLKVPFELRKVDAPAPYAEPSGSSTVSDVGLVTA